MAEVVLHSRAKTMGHVCCWIVIPDIGERALADFGKIVDFGKMAGRS
jgi:hypothetical protein